jgi:nucleotide-binding universal stress UspA family protein
MAVARSIVVPLDGSEFAERALPVAVGLARRIAGGILLVSAARGGPDPARPYLEKVAGTLEGVPVEPVVIHDRDAVGAIRLLATEEEGRVVCMTSHGRGGLRWAVLGSVAEEVIRAAHGPVILVGRRCATEPPPVDGHLLVCVDGTERSAHVMADAWTYAARS